ncbi:glycoside hydrolase family 2 [Flavobacterium sp. WLB]|uniref:malectin domain-containing carbohydrate-binding protein n=1 Tax=unclassified Flavobacterium TaxID=196869 RepID=UPI0006ABE9E7|nr:MULTISPECIES: malectin domain-containing carbohydrate-binding protein [unclassified Flavobacterium]KOP38206.1 glycoside hydrolase [Flavobacterium sp. VMW]OWU92297.1 glycoside hydrolase [Flavobacterium sp. NLM]PUU70797.1 glycoside hydrolase family 2 [Flavobacterium sp. WLB]
MNRIVFFIFCFFSSLCFVWSQSKDSGKFRKEISLNSSWETVILDNLPLKEEDFVENPKTDSNWQKVSVPHNWDQYYGYRRTKHGNLHGTAWYKKTLKLDKKDVSKQLFLYFEGVSSYATVWVNGKKIGEHKGGRTTFTLNITKAVSFDKENIILVKAAHPSFIADLPWVCGGCSGEWGFSEGSQPMGIFRPVSLAITNDIRIEPFGVHIWNDKSVSKQKNILHTTTEIKNYGTSNRNVTIENILFDASGKKVVEVKSDIKNLSEETKEIAQTLPEIINPKLWSPSNPYLYKLVTSVYENGKIIDQLTTPYGIRWVSWPVSHDGKDNRFFINDEPVFINGVCEYEHLIGNSHSFSDEMIHSRIEQIKAGGFNAFREAHQPHNLLYQKELDESGILFWSQFSAHIWYDTPEFKENFKTLLREWIKERRNSPSVVMWGLQNESTIPKEFAEECTKIIREMDPLSASQRIVTTCNGGEGTDWNVVQNWSGTYGGDPLKYHLEMTTQLLNGEYGAWRSADLHTEGEFDQKGTLSENRFSQLMEIKVREAESVKDKIAGQFNWLFASHENPGRVQNGEGFRDIDKVGPVNYKGLFTIWGEPLDAFYMYRSNYVSNKTNPMVYIVSHTWPSRWETAGIKNGIDIYSNCDEVELFNDVNKSSLGKLKNPGIGQHFQFNNVNIQYNVLYAVGFVNGKAVAKDYIILNTLPKAPNFDALISDKTDIIKAKTGYNYIYRVNCGGSELTDSLGNTWFTDTHKNGQHTWGSLSWTDNFEKLPDFFASQRKTFDPINGTKDSELFQSFRYGADKLRYEFPAPDGEYLIELYFTEPWYGTGGGMDCKGWRLFDVAINDNVVLKDFDIWAEAGHDNALKKTFVVKSTNGKIVISFPNVKASQAIISAIAIAAKDIHARPAAESPKNIENYVQATYDKSPNTIASWLDINSKQYSDSDVVFTELPSEVFGADYLQFSDHSKIKGTFSAKEDSDLYLFIDNKNLNLEKFTDYKKLEEKAKNSNQTEFIIFTKKVKKGEKISFDNSEEITTIAIVPTYDMGEKDDSRPVVIIEAENAKITGTGIEKGNFKKADYIEFTQKTNNSIQFEVKPGVAGIYLMRFRFMNRNETPLKVKFKMEDAYGILMRNDTIEFFPSSEKWKVLNTTSGGYINAGRYKITLEGDDLKGLLLDNFEFQ